MSHYLSLDLGDNSFFEQILLHANGPVPHGDPEGELDSVRPKGPGIQKNSVINFRILQI